MVFRFAIPTLFSSVSDYKKFKGRSEYAKIISYIDTVYTQLGERYDHKKKLILKINSENSHFELTDSYNKFWREIYKYGNIQAEFIIYNQSYGHYLNPMQIEANNKIILPLSYHKTWAWGIFIGFEIATLLLVWLFRITLKSYRKKFLEIDRTTWQKGFFSKLRVMFRFILG
ncbi:MAG: hypothetical protein ACHQF2_09115 [Flavobacteriales bacterium]